MTNDSGEPALASIRSVPATIAGVLMVAAGVLNLAGTFPPYVDDGIRLSVDPGTLAFNIGYSLLFVAAGFLVLGGSGTQLPRVGLGATVSLGLVALSVRTGEGLWIWHDKIGPEAGWVLQTLGDLMAVSAAILAIVVVAKAVSMRRIAGTQSSGSPDRTLALVLLGLVVAGIQIAALSVDNLRETPRGRQVGGLHAVDYGNVFTDASWPIIGIILLLVVTVGALVAAPFVREHAVAFGLIVGVAGYWVVYVMSDVVSFMAGNSKEYYGFPADADLRFDVRPTPAFSVLVVGVLGLLVMVAIYWPRTATPHPSERPRRG